MVPLGRAEVQQETVEQLKRILAGLADDPKIQLEETVLGLLITQAHIFIRFNVYKGYPTALWQLCRRFNMAGYVVAIQTFIFLSSDERDYGYSFSVRKRVLREGRSKAIDVELLMSSIFQEEIE